MGRKRLEIKKIENRATRCITYSKRKNGLVKKAHELSVLCDIDIGVIIFSERGTPFVYCAKEKKIEDLCIQYANISLVERSKWASYHTKELHKMVEKLNIEHAQAPIIQHLQLENEQLKEKLSMKNQETEFLKQKARIWNVMEHLGSVNNYDALLMLQGELDEAGKKVSQRIQEFIFLQEMQFWQQEHENRELFGQAGSFGMEIRSNPVLETHNQDMANMPSTSSNRGFFQEDFGNDQKFDLDTVLMSPLCSGNPTDSMDDQGAQIRRCNPANLMGGQDAQVPGCNPTGLMGGQGVQFPGCNPVDVRGDQGALTHWYTHDTTQIDHGSLSQMLISPLPNQGRQ